MPVYHQPVCTMNPSPAPSSSDKSALSMLYLENLSTEDWRNLIKTTILNHKTGLIKDIKNTILSAISTCLNKLVEYNSLDELQKDLNRLINECNFDVEYNKYVDDLTPVIFEFFCQFIIKSSWDSIVKTQKYIYPHPSAINTNSGTSCESIVLNSFTQSGESTSKLETNNNSLPAVGNVCYDVNIENNYVRTAESLVENEDDFDDQKNDQDLMSLALKISKSDISAEYAEDLIDKRLTNDISTNINSVVSNTSVIEHNGYQNNEPFKMDEEFRLNNGLQILESLVNTEHAKLVVEGESSTELELQPNVLTVEINHIKVSSDSNSSENNNIMSKEEAHKKSEVDKNVLKDKKLKKPLNKKKSISNRKKNRENKSSKNNNKKLDVQTNLDVSTCSSSIENQNNQYISVAINSSLIPSSSKKIDSKISTNTCTKVLLNNTKSVKIHMESQNLKNNPPISKSKTHSSNIEKLLINEKDYSSKFIDCGSISVPLNKSPSPSGSGMKTSDYKKMYELDRKSLFIPDIVFAKPKCANHSINNTNNNSQSNKKKEKSQQVLEKTDANKFKSKIKKNDFFTRNKKLDNSLKVKINSDKPKKSQISKFNPSSSTSSSSPKSSNRNKKSHNKFKRLKIYESDEETNNKIYVNKNKESISLGTLDSQESIKTKTAENKKSNINVFVNTMPEWLRIKYELFGCKPCSVVLK